MDVLTDAIRSAVAEGIQQAITRPEVRLLRPTDVAHRLGCSTRKVDLMLSAGEIPSVRVGRSRRVRSDSLDAYIDSLGGA